MDTQRLQQRIERLKRRAGANQALLDAVHQWLVHAEPLKRYRINPVDLARDLNTDLNPLLAELLHAVPGGLLDLHWDLHCPVCNTIANELRRLEDVPSVSHCAVCVMDFTADFAERVEVTFSLNTEIDSEQAPAAYFTPVSAFRPQYGMEAWFDETVSGEEEVAAGLYRYFSPITGAHGSLMVAGEPTTTVQAFSVAETDGLMLPGEITARPGPIRFTFTNQSAPRSLFWLGSKRDTELALEHLPPRLSGLQLSHHPVFRELFSDQVLSQRERLLISSVTTLFTDITSSTRMYESLGDAVAYNIVRDHFDILFQSIEDCGGRVLKTIGDAVMASFLNNEQAIRAIADFLSQMARYNMQRKIEEQVWLKLGLHRGSAILVTLNDRLDYFGSSVNKAARIQGLARSGELAFSAEVYDDPVFRRILDEIRVSGVTRQEVNLKGLEGNHTIYRVRLVEPPPEFSSDPASPMQRLLGSLGLTPRR